MQPDPRSIYGGADAAPATRSPASRQSSSTSARTGKRQPATYAAGALLVLFGALLWLAGAKYTLNGWHTLLSWFLAWLGLPVTLPPIAGYAVLLCIPIGVAYSLVELYRPWRYRAPKWDHTALYWVLWILIVISDSATTYLGVRAPGADAIALAQQVAASGAAAALWALILTFVPEWFMLGGLRLLRA